MSSDFTKMVRSIRIAHGDQRIDTAAKLRTTTAAISLLERGLHEVPDCVVQDFISAYHLENNGIALRSAAAQHNERVRKDSPTLQELILLTPEGIQRYLAFVGWEQCDPYQGCYYACYWHRRHGNISVPLDNTTADYPREVSEILRLLSVWEYCTSRQIYQAIFKHTTEPCRASGKDVDLEDRGARDR